MKKVLLVDDSISTARQLEKIVTESGLSEVIGHAKNGLEAVKMFQTLHPDIVFMDMNMPGMDGLTALRTLMALDKNANVIMVTSLGGVEDKYNEALKLGARNVVSKPFDTESILNVLK